MVLSGMVTSATNAALSVHDAASLFAVAVCVGVLVAACVGSLVAVTMTVMAGFAVCVGSAVTVGGSAAVGMAEAGTRVVVGEGCAPS